MKKRLSVKVWLIVWISMEIFTISSGQGEQIPHSSYDMREKLNTEKRKLGKLQTQLQILETQKDKEKQGQKAGTQISEQNSSKQANKVPIVINPNENIILTREMGEYDVPVYSIDATQVKVTDILKALSASFGKSIIVDEDVDPTCVTSFVNISIQKSPLQDILEVILGTRGLEFIQNEDSIFVTSLAKLSADTASEYYREKGARVYQKAQIKYPNDQRVVKAYFELGNYYYDLSFHFLALQEYKFIAERHKGCPLAKEALFKMGRCYDKLKDPESARRVYFQFMYSYPKDPFVDDALLSIGDSLTEQGLYYRAIDVYDRVIREFPNEDTAAMAQFNTAKTYVKMGNYRNAIQSFLLAREKCHSDQIRSAIEYQIGNCLYLLDEYQDAGNVLGNLLANEQEGEFIENASFLLGDCFYKQNNYLAAFQIFRKAIDVYPQSSKVPHGIYWMGKSLNAMNMKESAIKVFREGIQAYPDDDYASKMALEVGRCYFDTGDYWLAYNAFDSFVKQYPNNGLIFEGMTGMADALFNDKKYEKAINNYLEVIKKSNEEKIRQYAFKRIGDCYKFTGQLEQATKAYGMMLGKNEDAIQRVGDTDDHVGTTTSTIQNM